MIRRTRRGHLGRIVSGLALCCATVVAAGPKFTLSAQGGDLGRVRQRLEGSFALEEWKVGGKTLRPPQVDGRFSIHDGVVLFMTMRTDLPVPETVVGYGTYTIDGRGWTYGYTHLETIRAQGAGPLTRSLRPAVPPALLALSWDGDMLIVTGQGTDRREYGRESFLSHLSGGDYRRWRRMP